MICVYLLGDKLLTYRVDYATMEFTYIEDDLKGKTEITQEIALSRRSMV